MTGLNHFTVLLASGMFRVGFVIVLLEGHNSVGFGRSKLKVGASGVGSLVKLPKANTLYPG